MINPHKTMFKRKSMLLPVQFHIHFFFITNKCSSEKTFFPFLCISQQFLLYFVFSVYIHKCKSHIKNNGKIIIVLVLFELLMQSEATCSNDSLMFSSQNMFMPYKKRKRHISLDIHTLLFYPLI